MSENEKEMQEKMIMYQLLQRQLDIFKEQLMQLEKTLIEVETTNQILVDMKKLKKDSEVMISLGSGLFVQGKIINAKKIVMSPGANVMVENDIEKSREELEKKKKEMEKMGKKLQDEMNGIVQRINQIGPELEKMAQQARKKK